MSLTRSLSPVSFHFSSDEAGASRPALGGAIDCIMLYENSPDNIVSSSPIWIQFGHFSFRKACGRQCYLEVNGKQTGIRMILDKHGVGAFTDDCIDPELKPQLDAITQPPEEEPQYENQENLGGDDLISPPPKTTDGGLLIEYDASEIKSSEDIVPIRRGGYPSEQFPCSSKIDCTHLEWGKTGVFIPPAKALAHLSQFLHPGANVVRYVALSRTSNEPRSKIGGYIYLWPTQRRAVVFDVDGTITSSDTFGFVLPKFKLGKWQRKGVVKVAKDIVKLGYVPVYLTMRGLALASSTRKYLQKVVSEHKSHLPKGPVITCSAGILGAGKIDAGDYKSFALGTVSRALNRRLDGQKDNLFHFYGGFGNRRTDSKAYFSAGISTSRIFYFSTSLFSEDIAWRNYEELAASGYLDRVFSEYLNLEDREEIHQELDSDIVNQ
ncbi:hypothetical protein P9112_007939 [Eukaryota sp. TZLM1-RC]